MILIKKDTFQTGKESAFNDLYCGTRGPLFGVPVVRMADHKQIVFKISNLFGFDSETVKIPCLPSALSVNKVETRNKWQNVQIKVKLRKGMKFFGKRSSLSPLLSSPLLSSPLLSSPLLSSSLLSSPLLSSPLLSSPLLSSPLLSSPLLSSPLLSSPLLFYFLLFSSFQSISLTLIPFLFIMLLLRSKHELLHNADDHHGVCFVLLQYP